MRGFGKSRKIMLTYQQPGCFMHLRHVWRLFKLPEKPFEERRSGVDQPIEVTIMLAARRKAWMEAFFDFFCPADPECTRQSTVHSDDQFFNRYRTLSSEKNHLFYRVNTGVCPTRPDAATFFAGYQFERPFKLTLHRWYVRLILIPEKGTSVVGNEQFNVSGSICQGILTVKSRISVQQKIIIPEVCPKVNWKAVSGGCGFGRRPGFLECREV